MSESPRPRLYCTDGHVLDLPAGHKFPSRKYGILRRLMEQDRLFELDPASPVDPETLELTHTPDYVRGFLQGALSAAVMRRIGFPWSEALVQRACCSVGGTIRAALDALEIGCGGTLGRWHPSCLPLRGSGFLRIQ